jgi:hypothetical protein
MAVDGVLTDPRSVNMKHHETPTSPRRRAPLSDTTLAPAEASAIDKMWQDR